LLGYLRLNALRAMPLVKEPLESPTVSRLFENRQIAKPRPLASAIERVLATPRPAQAWSAGVMA
jgi:hypothetical protein